jgi:hypothetical protein
MYVSVRGIARRAAVFFHGRRRAPGRIASRDGAICAGMFRDIGKTFF